MLALRHEGFDYDFLSLSVQIEVSVCGGLGGASSRFASLEPLRSLVRGILGGLEDVYGVAALYAKRRHGVAIFPVAFEATHVALEIF